MGYLLTFKENEDELGHDQKTSVRLFTRYLIIKQLDNTTGWVNQRNVDFYYYLAFFGILLPFSFVLRN